MIRRFHLPAFADALLENAVVVTNAVAGNRQTESRTTVEKAGGKSAKTAIAEAGIAFSLNHFFQRTTETTQRQRQLILEIEIEHRIV